METDSTAPKTPPTTRPITNKVRHIIASVGLVALGLYELLNAVIVALTTVRLLPAFIYAFTKMLALSLAAFATFALSVTTFVIAGVLALRFARLVWKQQTLPRREIIFLVICAVIPLLLTYLALPALQNAMGL